MNRANFCLILLYLLSPLHAAFGDEPAPRCSSPADSVLGFEVTWEGSVFKGRFERFDAVIAFDPGNLAASRFDVRIDVTSARTGSRERDEGMAGSDWFNYADYPVARYTASNFQALEDGYFVADGKLELKGVTRPVPVKFRWEESPDAVKLGGGAGISRLDFGIGQGDWASDDIIGLPVNVFFDLELVECPAP